MTFGTELLVGSTDQDLFHARAACKQPWFETMYSKVLDKLRSKAAVTEVIAMKHLSKQEYAAVVITNAALLNEDASPAVNQKLVMLATSTGLSIRKVMKT